MTEDNLTKEKLLKHIGKNRFEDEEKFKDFLKPKIKEILAIPYDRLGEESASLSSDDIRYDIYVYDKETLRDTLILIGLKTINKYPKLTSEDIEKFHSFCLDSNALYGALITEAECLFFEYKKTESGTDINNVDQIPPLNHIDYEYEKDITPEKLMHMAQNKKWFLIAIGLLIFLLIFINISRAFFCASSGPIKADVTKDGQKIYYLPDSPGYKNITIGDQPGERHFCNEQDAVDKGWVKAKSENKK